MARYLFILAFACVLGVFSPKLIERVFATAAEEPGTIGAPAVKQVLRSTESYGGGREVRLAAGPGGHFVTDAEINNRSMRVMVDTGATVVALTADDARHAGVNPLPSEFNVPVRTANGVAYTARATLREIRISGVRVRDVEALVSQPGDLNITLLGMAFLSRLKQVTMRNGELLLVE